MMLKLPCRCGARRLLIWECECFWTKTLVSSWWLKTSLPLLHFHVCACLCLSHTHTHTHNCVSFVTWRGILCAVCSVHLILTSASTSLPFPMFAFNNMQICLRRASTMQRDAMQIAWATKRRIYKRHGVGLGLQPWPWCWCWSNITHNMEHTHTHTFNTRSTQSTTLFHCRRRVVD